MLPGPPTVLLPYFNQKTTGSKCEFVTMWNSHRCSCLSATETNPYCLLGLVSWATCATLQPNNPDCFPNSMSCILPESLTASSLINTAVRRPAACAAYVQGTDGLLLPGLGHGTDIDAGLMGVRLLHNVVRTATCLSLDAMHTAAAFSARLALLFLTNMWHHPQ